MEQLKEYIRQTYEIQVKPETLDALESMATPNAQSDNDVVVHYQNIPDDTVVFDDDHSDSADQ